MKALTPGASKPKPSWGQKPNQKKENNPQPQTILDEFFWEVPAEDIVTCYAIVTEEEGTSEAVEAPPSADEVAKIVKEESAAERRSRKRKERQRARRKEGFTKFNGVESPVLHLIQFITECCGKNPNPQRLRTCFGKSLGPEPGKRFRHPAIQAVEDWKDIHFLLRFFSQHRENTRRKVAHWLQCPGERTADYINNWRNAAWSDPKVTKVPERDLVRSCLSAAAYEGRHGPLTFASAYDKAKLRRMRVTPARTLEQFYVESHIQRVLKALEKGGSRPLAKHHPEVRQRRRLGWPVFKLFREGEVAPLRHLLRYHALVRLKKQGTDYALRHFPFSLACHSTALLWFAKLPEKSLASGADLVEAFMARFHDYSVRVTPDQLKAVRPLKCESDAQFIQLDTRLHVPYQHPESKMVRECAFALDKGHGSLPPTFAEWLKQVHSRGLIKLKDISCGGFLACKIAGAAPEEEGAESFPEGYSM